MAFWGLIEAFHMHFLVNFLFTTDLNKDNSVITMLNIYVFYNFSFISMAVVVFFLNSFFFNLGDFSLLPKKNGLKLLVTHLDNYVTRR